MKISLRQIKARLTKSEDDSGCCCRFYKCGRYGLKVYWTKSERDYACKMQKLAAEHKLGPKVGRKFEVWEDDYEPIYGYVTQRASPIDQLSDSKENKIRNELLSIGIDSTDLCAHNCGKINGKIVCVDFDNGSCAKRIK